MGSGLESCWSDFAQVSRNQLLNLLASKSVCTGVTDPGYCETWQEAAFNNTGQLYLCTVKSLVQEE